MTSHWISEDHKLGDTLKLITCLNRRYRQNDLQKMSQIFLSVT